METGLTAGGVFALVGFLAWMVWEVRKDNRGVGKILERGRIVREYKKLVDEIDWREENAANGTGEPVRIVEVLQRLNDIIFDKIEKDTCEHGVTHSGGLHACDGCCNE